ncbi:hypothetical protein D3C72_2004450 [compost metagenome]
MIATAPLVSRSGVRAFSPNRLLRVRLPLAAMVSVRLRLIKQLLGVARHPVARLAAMLFQQLHIADHHAAVHGLAHVVDRQQRHLHAYTNQGLRLGL